VRNEGTRSKRGSVASWVPNISLIGQCRYDRRGGTYRAASISSIGTDFLEELNSIPKYRGSLLAVLLNIA
jgi:hypothetical protein